MSRITITHDTEDHTRPKTTKIRFTTAGAFPEATEAMNPNNVSGSMQYPITLIDWNIELFSYICTLCFPAIGNLLQLRKIQSKKWGTRSQNYRICSFNWLRFRFPAWKGSRWEAVPKDPIAWVEWWPLIYLQVTWGACICLWWRCQANPFSRSTIKYQSFIGVLFE